MRIVTVMGRDGQNRMLRADDEAFASYSPLKEGTRIQCLVKHVEGLGTVLGVDENNKLWVQLDEDTKVGKGASHFEGSYQSLVKDRILQINTPQSLKELTLSHVANNFNFFESNLNTLSSDLQEEISKEIKYRIEHL